MRIYASHDARAGAKKTRPGAGPERGRSGAGSCLDLPRLLEVDGLLELDAEGLGEQRLPDLLVQPLQLLRPCVIAVHQGREMLVVRLGGHTERRGLRGAGRAGGRGAHHQAELVGGEAQRHDVVDQGAQVHVEHLLPAAGQRRPSASRLQTQRERFRQRRARGGDPALALGAARWPRTRIWSRCPPCRPLSSCMNVAFEMLSAISIVRPGCCCGGCPGTVEYDAARASPSAAGAVARQRSGRTNQAPRRSCTSTRPRSGASSALSVRGVHGVGRERTGAGQARRGAAHSPIPVRATPARAIPLSHIVCKLRVPLQRAPAVRRHHHSTLPLKNSPNSSSELSQFLD